MSITGRVRRGGRLPPVRLCGALLLLVACSSATTLPRPGPSWCEAGTELVVLHRGCPPADPGDQPPVLAPRGAAGCSWPGVMVCGFRLDDGPEGAIYACQLGGAITKFDLRAPARRVTGRCANNRADGDWLYYSRGALERTEHYRDGVRAGSP
jgi:hypothetical protein